MKRISYANTSVLVGDEFGTTLLEFAAALARIGTSETVLFTGIDEQDNRELEVSFIVGPASEIVVARISAEDPAVPEPDNAALVETMQRRIGALSAHSSGASARVVAPEPMTEPSTMIDGLDL